MATSAARKSSTLRKTEKEGRKEKEDFKWTDDESELLLSVTHEYKVKKLSESIDSAESQPYQNGSILFPPDTLTTGKMEYWSL